MGMFSTTGIRGISNEDITADFALKVGKTFGTFLEGQGNVLVGMDTRTSSNMLKNALVAGLLSTGVDVIDAGIVPITALGYAVKESYDAGIMVTSSHNPAQYNGFKFILESGLEITTEAEEKFEKIFNASNFKDVKWDKIGQYEEANILPDYIKAIKNYINSEKISSARLKVIADTGNGAQSVLIPTLLEVLGCEATTLHTKLTGFFERNPEPKPETLTTLREKIAEEGADIGIAFDIDGDRAIFVDENGQVIMGDVTGSLISRELLKKQKGTIVTTVATSKLIEDVVKEQNGKLIITEVGGKHVADALLKENGLFGFEEGGGCIFPEMNLTRDGALVTAKMLEILAISGKKFSEILGELPKYIQVKSRVECSDAKKEAAIEKAKNALEQDREKTQLITLDGAKALYSDGSLLIRASGTEPVIRVYSEALTEERAKELNKRGVELVKQ